MADASHDVVVVGGRVAGALTAGLLAARGCTVLVLESRRFPADTISTHYVRGDGLLRVVDRVGALEAVLRTGAPPLVSQVIHDPRQVQAAVLEAPEPGAVGYSLSVRRIRLDDIVAAHVGTLAHVEVRTGVTVTGLLVEGARVVGVRDANGVEHRADLVVGADGSRSAVARWVGASDVRREPPGRVLYYRYVTGWTGVSADPPDAAEFSWDGSTLAYVFPSDAGHTCLALSISVEDFEVARHDVTNHLMSTLATHAGLRERLAAAQPVGRVLAGPPRDSVVLEAAGPGWALVGDAGTHQDPWSGLGMDTAARQAEALAATWDGSTQGWVADYAAARDAVTLERFEFTTRGAADLAAALS